MPQETARRKQHSGPIRWTDPQNLIWDYCDQNIAGGQPGDARCISKEFVGSYSSGLPRIQIDPQKRTVQKDDGGICGF
jgi:hypothetical protein